MKAKQSESVLHDWVHQLTFQQQALLLTCVRGCDGLPKFDTTKNIIRFLRGAIMKPAGEWDGGNSNSFMWGKYSEIDSEGDFVNYWNNSASYLLKNHDHVPHHFLMHLIHCAEVIGYKHPDKTIREYWLYLYEQFCIAFHMTPETESQMDERLNDFGEGYGE